MEPGEPLLRRCPEAIEVEVAGTLVLHNLDTGGSVRLNSSGRLLWQSLDEARTLEGLTDVLVQRFHVDRARVRLDAGQAVRALLDRGLVQRVGDPA